MPDIQMTPGDKRPGRYRKTTLSAALVALIAAGASAPKILDQVLTEKEADRLTSYQDGRGIWTLCKGLTVYQGRPVHAHMRLTQPECDEANRAFIERDIEEAKSIIRPDVWERMSEPAKAGIADMVHNLGKGKARESTAIRLLNAGQVNEGCAAITLWVFDGSKDCRKAGSNCQGQPIRRMQEDELCLVAKGEPA